MTSTPPECVALAEGLREMRVRTGLSLAGLAERTAYSKSSWERYLNGKKPVPRQAVQALCAMAAEPPGRLLALWELADAEWSGRARHIRPPSQPPLSPAPVPAGAVGDGDVHRRPRRQWLFSAGVAAVATAAMLAPLAVQGHGAGPPAGPASPSLDPAPGCQGKACDGKDPQQMSCGLPGRADSLGPQHRTGTGARVEIRYSTVCAAAWGRIWHSNVGDTIEVSTPGSHPRRVVIANTADTGAYRFTPMIADPDRTSLRLCFLPAGGTGRECFAP